MHTSRKEPPRIAKWLLSHFLRKQDYHAVMGDFGEVYTEICIEKGVFLARLWYLGHVIRCIPVFVLNTFCWGAAMLNNYCTIALRNIRKDKGHSIINVTCLSIGLAPVILILLFVRYELSFDGYHEKSDRIYRIVREWTGHFQQKNCSPIYPAVMAPAMLEEFPEVVAAIRMRDAGKGAVTFGNTKIEEGNFIFTDPEIFELFSFKLVKGDPATALSNRYSIIISEKIADKYFRNNDPIGKTINYKGIHDFTITGIMKNIPKNSHFIMDFIGRTEILDPSTLSIARKASVGNIHSWKFSMFYIYLLLREDCNPHALERKIPKFLEKYSNNRWPNDSHHYLQRLKDIHLHSHLQTEISVNGDIKIVMFYSVLGVLILLVSCISFMNLTITRSVQRGKEVGVRKVMGASRGQLIKQFLGESIVFTMLAFLLAFLIVLLVLPRFNHFVHRDLSLNIVKNVQLIPWILGLILFVSICAGSYPALVISALKPVSIFTGKLTGSDSSNLRNILVIFQFTTTIIFIVMTFIVRDQLDYIRSKELGFRSDQILIVMIKDRETRNNIGTIKTELRRHPNIVSVSSSMNLPDHVFGKSIVEWPGRPDDVRVDMIWNDVDYDFVDLYEIEIVKGRNFSRNFPSDAKGAYLLNESAVKVLGWELPIGREFGDRYSLGRIVGIIKDFHSASLHQEILPLYLYFNPDQYHFNLSVKIGLDSIPGTLRFIKNTMERLAPGYPFEYRFFDEIINQAYQSEQRLENIFSLSALFSIVIACLGLFGMAAFMAKQRTKEIGIRKVLGASDSAIILLLSMEFTKWLLISNVIAWPVAYFIMNRWLQTFAFRARIELLPFIFSGGIALMIVIMTISYQAIKAARANPVDALRYK